MGDMGTIKIPRTRGEVTEELGQIGELLTATEWRRAALLAAVVRMPGSGSNRGSRQVNADIGVYTPEQFAALGLNGLRSHSTVRLYVQRWLDAHDGQYPDLGETVTVPDDEWPPTRTGTNGHNSDRGMRSTIREMVDKHGGDAVANALADEAPAIAAAAWNTVADRRVEAIDRLPSGGTIPEAVDNESRGRYDYTPVRETAMRDALVRGRLALKEMAAYEAEGNLSSAELGYVRELREAATAFVTTGMEVSL